MYRRASLALLAAVAALAVPRGALAQQGGTITGKVEATPAKFREETVVYLKEAPATPPKAKHAMDQKALKFVPHVLAIAKGDTVDFLNHDKVAHNVYSPDAEGFNLGSFKPEETRGYTFDKQTGAYSILCSIHPEMLGWVFVAPGPHAAAVDASGKFAIKNVPPGTYQLEVWNSHLKAAPKSVTVAVGKTVTVDVSLKR
jgi:plastocyanin